MTKRILIISFILVTISGCDETLYISDECTANTDICIDNSHYKCIIPKDGHDYVNQQLDSISTPTKLAYIEECAYGCRSDGMCNACIDGEKTCENDSVKITCVGGTWNKYPCEYGCKDGECQPEPVSKCTESATLCSGSTVQICLNGQWVDTHTCPDTDICQQGKCVCNTDDLICKVNTIHICKNDEWENTYSSTQCYGKDILRCKDSKWTVTNCEFGCYNNNCSDCEDGAKKCLNDSSLKSCVGGTWVSSSCHYGCDHGECLPSPCTDGDKKCEGDNKATICTKGAWILDKYCEYGCKDGECLPSPCTDGDKKCEGDNKVAICTNGAWIVNKYCEYGCDDGICKSKCDDDTCNVCSGNKTQCLGNILQTCIDGKWIEETCPDICQQGKCVCESGKTKCDNNNRVQTCINGNWWITEICSDICQEGKCVCEDGKTKCSNNELQTCTLGQWTTTKTCNLGCHNGKCDACKDNEKRCSGKDIQTCTNGAWVTQNTCKVNCKDGACTDVPTVGDKCDDKFVEMCDGNTGYYCSDGEVSSIDCNSNTPCAVRAADNYSDCAETCKASDGVKNTCMNYYGYPLSVSYTCDKTETGGYAYFMGNYEFCESSCENGFCTCTEEGKTMCSDKTVKVCKNNAWVTSKTCSNNCKDGACIQ